MIESGIPERLQMQRNYHPTSHDGNVAFCVSQRYRWHFAIWRMTQRRALPLLATRVRRTQ